VIRLLHQENKPSCVRPGQAGEISCVSPGLLPSIGATKLLQQRACLDQIGKSEALGERLVDRREQAACLGSRPAIPTKRNEALVACPPWIYQPQPRRGKARSGEEADKPNFLLANTINPLKYLDSRPKFGENVAM
jgi:hypothetical protein